MTGYEWMYINGTYRLTIDGYRLVHPEVTVEAGNFAHGVWTALAVTLAEPLRKALQDHLDGCPACGERGFCPEAVRLFRLLPLGDQIVIA